MDKLQKLSSPKGNIPSSKLHITSHLRKITVFWDATLCISVVTEHAASIFRFKNGSNMFI